MSRKEVRTFLFYPVYQVVPGHVPKRYIEFTDTGQGLTFHRKATTLQPSRLLQLASM